MKVPDVCHDDPPLTLYEYAPVPPNGFDIVIDPSLAPLHATFVDATSAVMGSVWVIVTAGKTTIHKGCALSLILTS